ncbi:MAG: glycosyltransferase, partial [Caldilineaceae bacterium]|nr:glycosyltransferase [Caldilineaceae bacterium]
MSGMMANQVATQYKVLLIYHGAALESSQKLFEALGSQAGIQLRVLAPRRGYNPFRKAILENSETSYAQYELVTGRVYRAMRDYSGPYVSGLWREIVRFRPDVIHVFNEAYSKIHLQTLLYKLISQPRAKCFCHGVENLIPPNPASWRQKLRRQFIHRYSDGATCWSTSAKDALALAGFPLAKLYVTYWGIPLTAFSPARNAA